MPRDDNKSFSAEEQARALARTRGWSEDVYADFHALQTGTMEPDEFREKYSVIRAILDLDITGFTETTIEEGQIASLLRIFDTQKIAVPVFERHGASLVRAFADDLVALFDDVDSALNAALAVHERMAEFNDTSTLRYPPQCCIGIGFGRVYAIGPNLAQGDEMNRASKLGEDLARGGETLLTERAVTEVSGRDDVAFKKMAHDDMLFPYYQVTR